MSFRKRITGRTDNDGQARKKAETHNTGRLLHELRMGEKQVPGKLLLRKIWDNNRLYKNHVQGVEA
jgi:hypothetical protein